MTIEEALRALSGGGIDLASLPDDLLSDPQLVAELAKVWDCPITDQADRATTFSPVWDGDW
jgi:hypothetical protein